MATVNLTRKARLNQKRSVSVFTAVLDFADLATTGDTYQLAVLPSNIVIVKSSIHVHTPFNAGTTATAALGFAGDAALVAAGNIKGAANTVAAGAASLFKDTGGVLTIIPTYTGAAATAGKILVYVEYCEYTKITGELTNFVG